MKTITINKPISIGVIKSSKDYYKRKEEAIKKCGVILIKTMIDKGLIKIEENENCHLGIEHTDINISLTVVDDRDD
ncbi:MAG: hypothetical protein ACTSYW_00625 [Candidatus Heimdallarchaeota archaeon]